MTAALEFRHFDQAVRPQDDLYRHVNGGWLATATIDDDKSLAGTFMTLRDESEKAVRTIITELAASSPEPGTEAWKIATLYSTFMDEEAIEAAGAGPLTPLLDRVERITDAEALVRHWGWSLRRGIGGVLGLDVDADPGDPSRPIMFWYQGGIGLPDEEYYRLEEHAKVREAYLTYLTRVLDLAGIEDAAGQAEAVLSLETRIAALHWDKVRTRDMRQMYNLRRWDDVVAESSLPWAHFADAARITPDQVSELVLAQPSFIAGLADLVTDDLLSSWRAWARVRIVSSLAGQLSSAFVQARFEFYEKTLMGVPRLRDRWKRGVSLVEAVMGEAVGRIYVERHFPPHAKQRMDDLVAHLLEAYRRSITELGWMTDQTRAEALDKLSKFRPKIGYPDRWRDYSGLEVVPGDPVGNLMAAASFALNHELGKIGRPIDLDEWLMTPQTVNAYYHPLRNEIVFPAAILQPPFFNVEADDAVNFGGIGAVIGHEIGHGFDDQGSTCDGDGRLRDWWTEDDRTAFEGLTGSLVAQYDALSPAQLPGVRVNGQLTIGENIGDLGGVGIALKAWRLATGGDVEPIDGLTGEQRFFLGYAQLWQTLIRDEALTQRIATDPHSPAEFRANQVVRNIDEFHTAFGVTEDDQMWLPPEQRVSIW